MDAITWRTPDEPLVWTPAASRGGGPVELTSESGEPVPDTHDVIVLRRGRAAAVRADIEAAERERELHRARILAVSRRLGTPHAVALDSAAILLGLRTTVVPDRVQIVVSKGAATECAADVERRRFSLVAGDVTRVHGIPVTTPERTVVDLARFSPARHALVAADHLMALRCTADRNERRRVEAEARRVRRALMRRLGLLPKGARGRRRALAVLEWSSPWAESAWESLTRWGVLTWGRRDVVAQAPVHCSGRTYYADLAIRIGTLPDGAPRWLVVEFDGRVKYLGPDAGDVLRRQMLRESHLVAAGHTVVRLDASLVSDRFGMEALLTEAIRAAGGEEEFDPLEPVVDLLPPERSTARRRSAA